MKRIPASDNLFIEVEPPRWRLLQNGSGAERVLVETAPGLPLSYPAAFGSVRRLPDDGTLDAAQVDRVILGWSQKDQAWHLGLMLLPPLAQERGSRWCELAAWNDGASVQDARQAGEELAQTLARPFTIIPPKDTESSTGASTAAYPQQQSASTEQLRTITPPPPLPALPYTLGDWRLTRERPQMLALSRTGKWQRSRFLKTIWYVICAVIFAVLSITSLTSGIGLPQPQFLPYLGIAGAVFLFLLAIYTLVSLSRSIDRIEIDGEMGYVRALKRRSEAWRAHIDDLEAVYISQIVSKVNERKMRQTVRYAELNILKRDGDFLLLAAPIEMDEKIDVLTPLPPQAYASSVADAVVLPQMQNTNSDQVAELTPHNAQTKAQAAALQISYVLHVPARYDQRVG